MGYRRPSKEPDIKRIVQQFEAAIRSLIRRFRNHPYAFYTETDMHCYLYHRLYAGGIVNGLYRTAEDRDTILLHKEYPTVARYTRQSDGTLRNDPSGRRRGHFDICVWDPRCVADYPHRGQRVLCAAELALNECGANSVHTLNDLTKLADPDNQVERGYLLFFVRDDTRFAANEMRIRDQLEQAAAQICVAFARVSDDKKWKLEYLGEWHDP